MSGNLVVALKSDDQPRPSGGWRDVRLVGAPVSQSRIATALIVLFAALNSLGLRTSSTVQQLLSLLKVLMLAALVIAAFTYSQSPAHAAHAVAGALPGVGFVAVVVSMQTVLEVCDGFNGACYFSEETNNPDRTVPRALWYGVLLVIGIYLAVKAALLHVSSPAEMGASKLVAADALARVWGPPARITIAILALVASLLIPYTPLPAF